MKTLLACADHLCRASLSLTMLLSAVAATAADPEELAVRAAAGRLPAIVREVMARSGVPGVAVAVVHRDLLVMAEGYGVRDVVRGGDVTADTVFQLASISKSLGASAVAAAIGKGRLRWDTPVAPLLPGFALADPWVSQRVTIGDLYAHRSGLPGEIGNDLDALGFDQQTIFERVRLAPLAPFRISYTYSNIGLSAGAMAAANASAMGWQELTRALLFTPLGMNRSTFSEAEFRRMDNTSVLHQKVAGSWVPGPMRHTDGLAPAGGASSSVNDMAHWLRMMLSDGRYEGRTVVAAAPLKAMQSLQIRTGGDPGNRIEGYGYGLMISIADDAPLSWSHAGDFPEGSSTLFYLSPDLNLGIIVLTNGWPAGVPQAVIATFDDLVRNGRTTRDWFQLTSKAVEPLTTPTFSIDGQRQPDSPVAARPLTSYVGSYSNDYVGEGRVTLEAGQLVLFLGPRGAQRRHLRHWSGDLFFYNRPDWPEGFYAAVRFKGIQNGTPTTMTLDEIQPGLGILTRNPR
jgi:CubicO group peptidase (beta-lactamase class C family)